MERKPKLNKKSSTSSKIIAEILNYGGKTVEKGKIIFLNGVSSTGKSTLSKVLQKRLSQPYYWLNVDNFMEFTDMSQNPVTYFEKGKDPISLFPHVVKLYSDMGVNVIVDVAFMKWEGPIIFLAEETMDKCVDMLHDYPIMYVHVTCPFEEVKRRHDIRGNRGGELKIEHVMTELVGDTDAIYDLTVDTFNESNEESADKIIDMLQREEKLDAFKTLWSIKNT